MPANHPFEALQPESLVLRTGEHVSLVETLEGGRVLLCWDDDGREHFITPSQIEVRKGAKL